LRVKRGSVLIAPCRGVENRIPDCAIGPTVRRPAVGRVDPCQGFEVIEPAAAFESVEQLRDREPPGCLVNIDDGNLSVVLFGVLCLELRDATGRPAKLLLAVVASE
jgi:hypothetical protein